MNPFGSKAIFLGSSNMKQGITPFKSDEIYFLQLTNSQSILSPRHSNFFSKTLPQLLGSRTKIFLGFTTNSLHHDTHKVTGLKWHNPPRNIPKFDKKKMESFETDCLILINWIIQHYLDKGFSKKDLKDKIVFVPTLPRFIFSCCKDNKRHKFRKYHHSNCEKISLNKIERIKQRIVKEHDIDIVKSYPISHFIYYSIHKMGVKQFFPEKILTKNLKRTFIQGFKILPKKGPAQILFFKEVLKETDNYTHFKEEYISMWGQYLMCLDKLPIVKLGTNVLFKYHEKYSTKKVRNLNVRNERIKKKKIRKNTLNELD